MEDFENGIGNDKEEKEKVRADSWIIQAPLCASI